MGQIKKAVLAHAAFAAATIGVVAIAGGGLTGEERYIPERDVAQPTEAEAMACWEQSATLGKPHLFLKPFVGTWDTKMRMWMDPSAPPMEDAGTATFALVLGGRFVKQDFAGSMMGMPFEGVGYTGYDNMRKQYVSSWMDSMSTVMLTMQGNLDAKGNVLTQIGHMDEPTTGEINKAYKWVTTWVDDDTFTFGAYEILYGEGVKVFEIEYRRKK